MPKKKTPAKQTKTEKKTKVKDLHYYHKRAEDLKRHPSKG